MVMGTRSGNMSSGNRDGGNTGGTFVGKVSDTAVTIKLVFPVPRSPATTILIPFLFPAAIQITDHTQTNTNQTLEFDKIAKKFNPNLN